MKYTYAEHTKYLRPSAIRAAVREIRPGMISFAGGSPSPESFMPEELLEADRKILTERYGFALGYSSTEGVPELIDIVLKEMERSGIHGMTGENIIITNGSQQGLDLIARLFLDEGDVVICEDPGYVGGLNAIAAYGPQFVGVAMDEEGMLPDELDKALTSYPNAKFIYLVPTFQNPTGRCMQQPRRQEILSVAKKHQVLIIEDDPYSELFFSGEKQLPIKHYDDDFNVIYLGTFSKTFCPGMRVAWICADKKTIELCSLCKANVDLQTGTWQQLEVATVIQSVDWPAHLADIRAIYKRKRDLMMRSMEAEFPKELKYTYPEGGFFTWVTLPETVDEREVFRAGLEKQVAFVPGNAFYANSGPFNHIRLSFSTSSDEEIVEGIKRIGAILRDMCQ